MSLVPVHPPANPMLAKLEYAREMAEAELLPKAYRKKPANVLVAIEYGEMLDLHPLTAIAQVHVIDGKPSQSAELMRAQVARAGHRFRTIEMSSTQAVCEVVRSDDPEYPTRFTFTIDNARAAGLLDTWWEQRLEQAPWKKTWIWPDGDPPAGLTAQQLKAAGAPEWVCKQGPDRAKRRDPWWQYRTAMLHARCTSAVVRAACPEVLMGVSYTPEELGAAVNADGDVIDVAEVAPLGREQQQAATPEQQLADPADFEAIKGRLVTCTAEQLGELKVVWKKSQFPSLDSGVLTVGQVGVINGWLDELAGKDDPDPDGPGTGSAPDEQGVSDALVGDPEHAAEGGDDGTADQGQPASPPPVETIEAAPAAATSSQEEQPAANGGAGVVDPPAPTRPRGAQIDVFKIAERVFTINGNPKAKRDHAEKMRHRLTGVLTQGRTESTSDLSDDELKGLVDTMVAIERGELELVQSANGGGAWSLARRPGSKRSAA